MEVKEVRLGSLPQMQPQEVSQAVVPTTEVTTERVANTPEEPASTIPSVVGNEGAVAPPEGIAPQVQAQPEIQDEVVDFIQPSYEKSPEQPQQPQPTQPLSWKDALKDEAKKSEILKELGIDPLVMELNEHIKRGGKATDYLNAKAVDYTAMSDRDIIMQDLKEKYPTLTQEKLNKYFEGKYKQADVYDDDLKELGSIELEADAANARTARISKQQSFKLPEPIQPQTQAAQPSPEMQQATEQANQFFKKLIDSESTKNLIQSKRVAIEVGEGLKPINVSIPNPQGLYDVLFNPEINRKAFLTPQGEPDAQKIQEVGLFMSNPALFKKLLRGIPKEIAKQELVEEGQNAVKPATIIPMTGNRYSNVGEAFNSGNIKMGKAGSYGI